MLATMNRRLPWARRLVWSLKYRINRSVRPYNGMWDKVQDYLVELDRCGASTNGSAKKILVYASAIGARFWIDYFLPVSVLLAARGARVDFVWSDTPTGPPEGYFSDFLQWSATFAKPERQRWHPFRLETVAAVGVVSDAARHAIERLSKLDVCQLVRKETLDDGDATDRATLAYRRQVNTDAWKRFEGLLAGGGYDRVLTVNGGLYESAILLQVCKEHGIPCVTTEVSERDNTLHFAVDKAVWDLDIEGLWAADEPHRLSAERAQRVQALRASRAAPVAANGQVVRFQSADVQEASRMRAQLRLDAGRKLALLCSNVVWDSAVLGKGRTHATMKEWLIDTIAWFAKCPGWQLVIRTHPHEEVWGSNEPVNRSIRQAYPHLPENVRVVNPSDPINTYSLLPLADLGLVFSTTVGLEMAMEGLTVVTAGRVHYAERGFTIDPSSREQYYEELARLTQHAVLARDQRRAEVAMCYFDIYMNQNFRPMPWRWTHLDEDVRRVPITRLASAQCEPQYAKVYDYLMGLRDAPQ
jgi:hypothetical protein